MMTDDDSKKELIKKNIKHYMRIDADIDQENIGILYDLWINNVISNKPENDNYNHHLGVYYGYRIKNTQMMKTFLKPLVKKGNLDVMDDLAFYYSTEGNHFKTVKYFKILIKHGDIPSMYNLAEYYENHDNIKKAKKYLKLASKNGFKDAYLSLSHFYDDENKYQKALYYYLLSDKLKLINRFLEKIIEGNVKLGLYFDQSLPLLNKIKEKIILPPVIRKLVDIYDKYQILQHDIVHYAPNFDGYIESKNEFTNLVRRT